MGAQARGPRLIPRIGEDDGSAFEPVGPQPGQHRRASVIGPRRPESASAADADLPGRPFATADDEYRGSGQGHGDCDYDDYDHHDHEEGEESGEFEEGSTSGRTRKARTRDRRAYHPGRRRSPGLVLLPLRVFLGGISVYAGMSKLCDPAFFDGGARGSMARWLSSLEPWAVAAPLLDLAVGHPVGAGLTVAFIQIIAGMLTAFGLWQRLAAGLGMLLSVALLVTVSWRSAPAYDVPDIIYLAAWSPLLIAGAPAYSLDGRLANEAWRRLGPRSSLFELRRWVLRRGMVIATVVVGLTLLIGSALGGAVRAGSFRTDVPDPSEPPTNHLPGEPLPSRSQEPGRGDTSGRPERSKSPSATPSSPETSVTTQMPQPTRGGTLGGTGGRPDRGGSGSVTQPKPSPPPSRPRQPGPTPTSEDGALGGILGAGGGLLGMPPRHSPDGYVSA